MAAKLATHIERDLRNRLQSGDVPKRLALAVLAAEYGVSTTPVRRAISRLVADGYVLKDEAGRLSANPTKVGAGGTADLPDAPPTPTDWDQALIQEIMHASLGTQPVYLREMGLADRHGVGRSIIRQALMRLAGAGLVEHVPRRGWLVRPLRERDVLAYLAVREVLELKALDLAREQLRQRELQRLLRANPLPVPGRAPVLNNELHQYIIDRSGNRYIREFFAQPVSRYYTALFDFATPEVSVVAGQGVRHRRILEALLAEDWEGARRELSAHIRSQADVLRTLLGRQAV